jgi:hypothetical protein
MERNARQGSELEGTSVAVYRTVRAGQPPVASAVGRRPQPNFPPALNFACHHGRSILRSATIAAAQSATLSAASPAQSRAGHPSRRKTALMGLDDRSLEVSAGSRGYHEVGHVSYFV